MTRTSRLRGLSAGLCGGLALLFSIANPQPTFASATDTGVLSNCQFTLGFKTLHDLDPGDVGNCTGNQTWAANGDATQPTDRGLLTWRKADNYTAFTNGTWTWVNGPFGLQRRLNVERFVWELPGVQTGDPTRTVPSSSDMAVQLFNMVNQDRQVNGLQPVVFSPELSRLAQGRADGLLAARGPLSHYDANGNLVLREIVTDNRIPFVTAGENLADNNFGLPQTVSVANISLMNSAPHRANILAPAFNQLGVGVAGPDVAGDYYYVELFVQTS